MKALHIIGSMKPEAGGASTFIDSLIKNKSNKIHHHILCSDKNVNNDTVSYYKSYFGNLHLSASILIWLFRNANKYDVLIIHSTRNFYLIAAYLVKTIYKKKILVFLHGSLHTLIKEKKNIYDQIKILYFQLIDRNILKKKNVIIICTSLREKHIIKKYITKPKNKLLLLNLGIVAKKSRNYKKKNYYLYLGRFDKIKRLNLICKTFSSLDSKKCKILIVGKFNNYSEYLRKKYKKNKNIIFKNFVYKYKKFQLIREAKALILASYSENFSISTIECLSQGTPVIISQNLDISNLVKNKRLGLTFYPNEDNLKKKILEFNKIPKFMLRNISIRARKVFLHNYDINIVTQKFEKNLKRIIN